MSPSPLDLSALNARLPSPITEIREELLSSREIRLFLKRDDQIHPDIPGNKWRKLKYNLIAAKEQNYSTLLTFGGAYSNHIRAVAAAGHHLGFSTIGIIRGEEHLPLNDSLVYATGQGMRLDYLDRTTYRRKNESDVISSLREKHGDFYLIPEGGSNTLAVQGCAELPREIDIPFDLICCAAGTGGTLAGIAAGLSEGQSAIGFSALKGGQFLNEEVAALQRTAIGHVTTNWLIELNYHFGGYAKRKPELDNFIENFRHYHDTQLDWVYVAKMMYGIFDMIESGRISAGSRVVAVITG